MPTIQDIAERVGVSSNTVSRALRGKITGQRQDAAERVRKIRSMADQMGYRPNAAARATRLRRHGAIGLLLSEDPGAATLPWGTFWGIQQALHDDDLGMVVGSVSDDILTDEAQVPRLLRVWSVDGMLISYATHVPDRMRQLIDSYGMPAVWMNIKLDHDCVHPDDHGAAVTATEHLLSLGHRKIAYIDAPNIHYSGVDRLAGYKQTMAAAGLSERIVTWDPEEGGGVAAYRPMLSGADRPTAVVAASSTTFLLTAWRMGLELPRDLSLVSLRDTGNPIAEHPVSTMVIPTHDLGETAVATLKRKLRDPRRQRPAQPVPFHAELQGTCGPPPGAKT